MGIGRELRRLVEVRPAAARRWPTALNASVALALPALVLTLAGEPKLGLLASNGAFLTLYLGDRPLGHRARRLPLVGAGLFLAAALATLTAGNTVVATVVVAAIALASAILTLGLRVGPPGGVFFAMVPGLAAALVAPMATGGSGMSPVTLLAVLALGLVVGYLVVIAPSSCRACGRARPPADRRPRCASR
ncbi:hypothetical protein [Naasia aerilata]|uniref:FUSC family protein n=1 Tax=Naasia aerilata TaxID=1162966 RepID=A0ABM8GGY9_9MICO|nr:hypothetical protein [Naasia aerilata]BDZ47617.1 hypothetical protein GCM10025866_35260 [Naasia aerilata]